MDSGRSSTGAWRTCLSKRSWMTSSRSSAICLSSSSSPLRRISVDAALRTMYTRALSRVVRGLTYSTYHSVPAAANAAVVTSGAGPIWRAIITIRKA